MKFIFNLDPQKFVFMTDRSVYIVNYDSFAVNDNHEIVFKRDTYSEHKKNKLFDFLKNVDIRERKLKKRQSVASEGEKDSIVFNVFLIFLAALLIIVMISHIYLNEVKNVKIKELPNLIKSYMTK